jgi:predicted DNA-binding transcriptional regulator YafY
VIDMRYFSAASNRAKSYVAHPYRLALAQGGVYLIAWVPAYGEFRTFAVERVERLTVSEETFRKTHELPADLFASSMGVFWAPPERIEVEFEAAVAPFVRGRIWHDSQRMTEQPDGRIHLSLDVSNDWALRSWLLGFGAGVRVVAPPELAATMARELARALEGYRAAPVVPAETGLPRGRGA